MSMFVANWKMNLIKESLTEYVDAIQSVSLESDKDVVLCPPFTHLHALKTCFSCNSILGAQSLILSRFAQGALQVRSHFLC